ncbi:MAG: CDP-alcohol phosphatidyltransferase family protein [Planctomycetota bacterium]
MTDTALVLVREPQRCLEDHAGMPLIKRTVLAAQKGGIREFIVVNGEGDADAYGRLRASLSGDSRINSTIHWHGPDDGDISDTVKDITGDSIIIIKAESVFDSGIIREMCQPETDGAAARIAVHDLTGGDQPGRCTVKLDGDDVVDCGPRVSDYITSEDMTKITKENRTLPHPEGIRYGQTAGLILTRPDMCKDVAAKALGRGSNTCDIVEALLHTGNVKAVDVTGQLCMEITSPESMGESKERLFGFLGLVGDSPFSTYVSRKFSRLVSGVLVEYSITPNQITLVSFFIALVACWFYLQGGYRYSVLGAFILYVSILFDLADGEVARLKFTSSKYGALLDSICDSIVGSVVLFCIALAADRIDDVPNIITVGAVAAVSVFICTNLDTYIHLAEKDLWENKPSPLEKIFANEDCFYLALLGFTLLGMLPTYLWIVAAGTIVYTFVMLGEMTVRNLSLKKA